MYDSSDFERLNNGFMSSSLLGYDKRLSNIRTPSVTDTRVPFGHTNLVGRDNASHKRGMSSLSTGRMNKIVLPTSHSDSNLDLSDRFLEEKTSAKIHYLCTSKQFLKRHILYINVIHVNDVISEFTKQMSQSPNTRLFHKL